MATEIEIEIALRAKDFANAALRDVSGNILGVAAAAGKTVAPLNEAQARIRALRAELAGIKAPAEIERLERQINDLKTAAGGAGAATARPLNEMGEAARRAGPPLTAAQQQVRALRSELAAVKAPAELDRLRQQLAATKAGLDGVGTAADAAAKHITGIGASSGLAGKSLGDFLRYGGQLVGFGVGFSAAQAGINAVRAGLDALVGTGIRTAASLEKAELQFKTLTGSADAAKSHVAELFRIAQETPFSSEEIIQASKNLENFGRGALDTKQNLTLVGDAAAATGASIGEISFWVGRAYAAMQAGQPFGEARMRLQELAVLTPQAAARLESLSASGASAQAQFGVLQQSLQRFTGAMREQQSTWEGLTSTLSDTFALLTAGAFRPVFDELKNTFRQLNESLQKPGLATLLGGVGSALGAMIAVGREALGVVGNFAIRVGEGVAVIGAWNDTAPETQKWIREIGLEWAKAGGYVEDFNTRVGKAVNQPPPDFITPETSGKAVSTDADAQARKIGEQLAASFQKAQAGQAALTRNVEDLPAAMRPYVDLQEKARTLTGLTAQEQDTLNKLIDQEEANRHAAFTTGERMPRVLALTIEQQKQLNILLDQAAREGDAFSRHPSAPFGPPEIISTGSNTIERQQQIFDRAVTDQRKKQDQAISDEERAVTDGLQREQTARERAIDHQVQGIEHGRDAAVRGIEDVERKDREKSDLVLRGLDHEAQAARDAADSRIRALDDLVQAERDRHDAALDNLKTEEDAALKGLNNQLGAIDAAARKRAEAQTDKSNAQRLAQAKTPEEKAAAAAAIAEEAQRRREDAQRESIRAQIDATRERFDAQKKAEDDATKATQRGLDEQKQGVKDALDIQLKQIETRKEAEKDALQTKLDALRIEKQGIQDAAQADIDTLKLRREGVADYYKTRLEAAKLAFDYEKRRIDEQRTIEDRTREDQRAGVTPAGIPEAPPATTVQQDFDDAIKRLNAMKAEAEKAAAASTLAVNALSTQLQTTGQQGLAAGQQIARGMDQATVAATSAAQGIARVGAAIARAAAAMPPSTPNSQGGTNATGIGAYPQVNGITFGAHAGFSNPLPPVEGVILPGGTARRAVATPRYGLPAPVPPPAFGPAVVSAINHFHAPLVSIARVDASDPAHVDALLSQVTELFEGAHGDAAAIMGGRVIR